MTKKQLTLVIALLAVCGLVGSTSLNIDNAKCNVDYVVYGWPDEVDVEYVEQCHNGGDLSDEAYSWWYSGVWKNDTGSTEQPSEPQQATSSPAEAGQTAPQQETTPAKTSATTSKEEVKKQPEITTDNSIAGAYVVIKQTDVLSSYDNGESTGSVSPDTSVAVTGLTSNGYYVLENGYIAKDNLVTQAEYDAAWEEQDGVAPTCTEDGYTLRVNSLTGLEDKQTVAATGHKEGDWVITKKPGLFTEGEQIKTCDVCGEVLATETIKQTCPLPLAAVVGIVVVVVAAIIGLAAAVIKHKKI